MRWGAAFHADGCAKASPLNTRIPYAIKDLRLVWGVPRDITVQILIMGRVLDFCIGSLLG